jgi:hypothetical protein
MKYYQGMIVKMTTDYQELSSTIEFLGQEGIVMDMKEPREDYVKVKFHKKVRNRDWWWVPKSDLIPPKVQTWEI